MQPLYGECHIMLVKYAVMAKVTLKYKFQLYFHVCKATSLTLRQATASDDRPNVPAGATAPADGQ